MNALSAARGSGSNLLARPGAALLEDLDRALAAIAEAFPVPASRRRDMPYAVRDLSRMLTVERAQPGRSYWSAPRLLAAYLRYFLPWNLYRMAWLLPGLDLPLRPGARILDLGSGPLALPLALWCARPDLRSLPLSFLCCDTAAQPMKIGRDILHRLAGEHSPWSVTLQRDPLEKALARPGGNDDHDAIDCITAGNMLNELFPSGNASLEERLERLMDMVAGRLRSGGLLFLVEPGTRLGGKLISLARKGALARGFSSLAPCTHDNPCPMLESARLDRSSPFTGWCHFFHPAADAPRALADLSRHAKLEKDSLAVSCLLLRKSAPDAGRELLPVSRVNRSGSPEQARSPVSRQKKGARPTSLAGHLDELEALYAEIMGQDAKQAGGTKAADLCRSARGRRADGEERRGAAFASRLAVRVISDMIRLPNETEPGRYACCEQGLALLLDAARVPSGAFAVVPGPGREEREPKTGALLLRRPAGK